MSTPELPEYHWRAPQLSANPGWADLMVQYPGDATPWELGRVWRENPGEPPALTMDDDVYVGTAAELRALADMLDQVGPYLGPAL